MIIIRDEILKINVYLAVGSNVEFVEYLNENFKDSIFIDAVAGDYNKFKTAEGYCIGDYHNEIFHLFIWLRKFDESAYWLRVLSHECNEATRFVFDELFQAEKYTHANIRYQDELFETCLKKIRGKNG